MGAIAFQRGLGSFLSLDLLSVDSVCTCFDSQLQSLVGKAEANAPHGKFYKHTITQTQYT